MKKSLIALGAVALLLGACSSEEKGSSDDDSGVDNQFTINFNVPDSAMFGKEVLLVSIDGTDTIATAVVSDTVMSLKGKINDPKFCVLQIDHLPVYNVVVESGDISFTDKGFAIGTKSNDAYAKYMDKVMKVVDRANTLVDEDAVDSLYYNVMVPDAVDFVKENPNNLYNQAIFQQFAYDLNADQINTFCENDSTIKANPEVQSLLDKAKRRQLAEVGNPYINVSIPQADGSVRKLSDWITPGRYTIVDFWASWCNPCRQEIPGLVEIYKQYKNAGIDVVGVAVWDEIADTEKAVKELGIPYPVITIPKDKSAAVTDAYGIVGIPFIIMIDPQGKIVGSNLRGDEIKVAVEKAIASKRR